MTTYAEIMHYREALAAKNRARQEKRKKAAIERQNKVVEMAKMYIDGGLSYAEIGKRFGYTRSRVHQLLKQFELCPPARPTIILSDFDPHLRR